MREKENIHKRDGGLREGQGRRRKRGERERERSEGKLQIYIGTCNGLIIKFRGKFAILGHTFSLREK